MVIMLSNGDLGIRFSPKKCNRREGRKYRHWLDSFREGLPYPKSRFARFMFCSFGMILK